MVACLPRRLGESQVRPRVYTTSRSLLSHLRLPAQGRFTTFQHYSLEFGGVSNHSFSFSSMSAAQVLQDSDLSWSMCEELAMERCSSRLERDWRRQDLASPACVCRDLVYPATRVLWRVMSNIHPLLNLISYIRVVHDGNTYAV